MSEPLTVDDLKAAWEKQKQDIAELLAKVSPYWQVTPEDTPDRHKDYLPLNLWDDTQDE